jgi:hypothetical protein
MENTTDDRTISQARSQLDAICELVEAYGTVHKNDADDSETLEAIYSSVLDVSVRSDWQPPGRRFEPGEYQLLLCWGGPACRVIGELDGGDPITAHIEYQDWFTPWQELRTSAAETEALIDYARFFHFGS